MRRLDLPFGRDQSTRFLAWIVALMVFLAVLVTAFAVVVGDAVKTWDSGLTGRLTVQVPVAADGAPATPVEDALAVLRATPGVAAATPLEPAAVTALLEPWLGTVAADLDLPMPALIDVQLAPRTRVDSAALATTLAAVVPGIAVDDHRVWLDGLIDLAVAVQIIAAAIVAVIGLTAVAAVVFATRSGLAVHFGLIELLHQLGARDGYVARQFQGQALRLGIRGGLAGSLAAAAALAGIAVAARDLQLAFMPALTLAPAEWTPLAAVPVGAVALVIVTVRLTVLRALARMP